MQTIKKYIALVPLLAAPFCFCCAQIAAGYTITSESESPQILTVKKHSKGYFLLGTSDGLFRFNGNSFSPYANTSTTKKVTAVAEDTSSTIWVGFQDGQIGVVHYNSIEMLQAEEGHPRVAITSIATDNVGRIYFATAGEGVYYYTHHRFYNLNTDDGLSDDYVYEIVKSNAGMLACTDRGVNLINIVDGKKQISTYTAGNSLLPDNIVRCLSKEAGNDKNLERWWLGMQDKGTGIFTSQSRGLASFSFDDHWQFGQINSILNTSRGTWIATEHNGILQKDSDGVAFTKYYTGLSKTGNLLQDNEGNLWFTSNNQLLKINGVQLQNIVPLTSKVNSQVHALLQDRNNDLWININGGLRKYTIDGSDHPREITFSLPEIQNKAEITSLYEDTFGNIWIGTMGQGMYVLDPANGRHRRITEDKLLINSSILSISGRGLEVWISSLEGAVHCNLSAENKDLQKPYQFLNFKNVSSLGSNYIYSIFVDTKDRVWFATDGKGITVYNKGKFTNYSEREGLQSTVIYNICEDDKGNLWFSALNKGLYKFDGQKFTNFSVEQGLNDATVTALASGADHTILAITKKGGNVINTADNSVSYLDANQRIEKVNTDLNCITGSNAVYFVASGGIMRYMPFFTSLRPALVLTGVQVFFAPVPFADKNTFAYDENNLNFSYSGIAFSHPDKLRYQYKIDGLGNEWISTKDNNVNIPRFPPGKYVFRVRASINDNFAGSREVTYAFTIKKPFWWQWWFILLVVVVLVSGILLFIRLREKQLKRLDLLEKEKIQSQFETLKSQVNPHFLFNSFNTLIAAIENDPQSAVEYVEHLSDLYRKIVTYRDKDVITLQEEIDISNDYFFIQKKRFGNNLQFVNGLTHADQIAYMIAPLTLQLLTENAVKHNAVSTDTPLQIEISIKGKYLVVKNNLNPKVNPIAGEGMGLQNIQHRYRLLSSVPVIIEHSAHHFIVHIPLLTTTP